MTTFPNVPPVPGVPPVPRDPSNPIGLPSLLTSDDPSAIDSPTDTPWGLFLDGDSVVEADNVVSFEYKQDWTISTYPLEKGAFESYDKVQVPFESRIRFSRGGSESDRQAFLDSIAAIAGDMNLYDAVTPEEVYTSVNIQHYDYERTSQNGVGLITVDLWVMQVRVTAQQAFSNTKDPSGASPQNGGTVQPQDPTPTQANAATAIG